MPASTPFNVRLADGSTIESSTLSGNARFKIHTYSDTLVGLPIVPLEDYDAILGKPWLARLNPSVNWRTNLLAFSHRRQQHLLVPNGTTGSGEELPAGINLMTSNQLKSAIKEKGAQVYLVVVRPADSKDPAPKPATAADCPAWQRCWTSSRTCFPTTFRPACRHPET